MKSVELFAGGGGLGLGLSLAGFSPEVLIELDKWACDTIRENKKCAYPLVKDWEVWQGDARQFDYASLSEGIDLVSGGPPCQPFSIGGKHRGHRDRRDMFPMAVDVVRRLAPRAFIFENVKGITRSSFTNYFQYIQLQLSFPEVICRKNENWLDHLARLERHRTGRRNDGLIYNVVVRKLNAANYGVPQRRERVFMVGFRNDQREGWSFPKETHCLDALLADQWLSGAYWERHEVPKRERSKIAPRFHGRVARLRETSPAFNDHLRPWRTVRDSLGDLPNPRNTKTRGMYSNHRYQPGARVYTGHTGSPLDLPAKTLKAGDHGVPGGENMMVLTDGSVRYFTVREAARLQTFPDGYRFHGSWTETMRQLGNAVPVVLAQVIGSSVAKHLLTSEFESMVEARRRSA